MINTSQPLEKYSPKDDAYYKWSFICYSENHTKQLDFFNVKTTAKRDDIIKALRKFTINGEFIQGILDDVRYDFKETIFNTDDLYQVNYRNNSKSFVEDIYSPNVDTIKYFYRNFIAGELVEIRKYEYLNIALKPDDGNYYKRLGINVISNLKSIYTAIPKIKKSINFNEAKSKISDILRFDGKKIDKDKITISITD